MSPLPPGAGVRYVCGKLGNDPSPPTHRKLSPQIPTQKKNTILLFASLRLARAMSFRRSASRVNIDRRGESGTSSSRPCSRHVLARSFLPHFAADIRGLGSAFSPRLSVSAGEAACPTYSSSCCAARRVTTLRSSSVVTSPPTEPEVTISLSSRRMILPLRVFGSASVKRICSGLAKLPIS